MKYLLISILIITLSYVLSDVSSALNDNKRILLESSTIKHRNYRNHFSGKRIRTRKYSTSVVGRSKHVKTKPTITTTHNPNILNKSNDLYKLNIDYLPGSVKLPVLPIQNLSNHKPIDYGNDWTHWEIPKGQYFTVLQTLMIQRENIDMQIQHTFGLLNAERKLRDEPLLDYSDYSPCNKKNINNFDDKGKNELITEKKDGNGKILINQLKSAQITFNEPVSERLDCQCKVLKENNKIKS